MSLNAQVFRRTHRRSSVPWLLAALAILATAVGIVGTTAMRASQIRPPPAETCTPAPPKDASPAAVAFLDAVAAATPTWQEVDARLAAQDNVTARADITSQFTADRALLASLRAITYPPVAQPAATATVKALQAYLAFLQRASKQAGYLAKHPAEDEKLTANRSTALTRLRADLGLPPSDCVFRLP